MLPGIIARARTPAACLAIRVRIQMAKTRMQQTCGSPTHMPMRYSVHADEFGELGSDTSDAYKGSVRRCVCVHMPCVCVCMRKLSTSANPHISIDLLTRQPISRASVRKAHPQPRPPDAVLSDAVRSALAAAGCRLPVRLMSVTYVVGIMMSVWDARNFGEA